MVLALYLHRVAVGTLTVSGTVAYGVVPLEEARRWESQPCHL